MGVMFLIQELSICVLSSAEGSDHPSPAGLRCRLDGSCHFAIMTIPQYI
jgi:hypothetical protein